MHQASPGRPRKRFLSTFLKDILTGIDGKTYAIARVVSFINSAALLVFQAWSLAMGHPFDAMGFGAAATGIVASTGYAVRSTSDTEPVL
jgi:hypothetical protein